VPLKFARLQKMYKRITRTEQTSGRNSLGKFYAKSPKKTHTPEKDIAHKASLPQEVLQIGSIHISLEPTQAYQDSVKKMPLTKHPSHKKYYTSSCYRKRNGHKALFPNDIARTDTK
jgi:hypothetical protein